MREVREVRDESKGRERAEGGGRREEGGGQRAEGRGQREEGGAREERGMFPLFSTTYNVLPSYLLPTRVVFYKAGISRR